MLDVSRLLNTNLNNTLQIKLYKSILFLTIFFSASITQASITDELVNKASFLTLSKDPLWLKLLHYQPRSPQSDIITDTFFISPSGKSNPQEELTATIKAYFQPWGDNPDMHPRCKYPARYYWLSKHLNLPDFKFNDDRCQALNKWAMFDKVNSISIILVSGYFGNPASTFGHAIMKFNSNDKDDTKGFFDLTLGFGAMVPENENGIFYVLRGLFGGYKSGFSDKYYYTQDIMYTRTEFRDMWDYQLNLTDDQRTFLILHIWEIIGSKFAYYFLTKNCSYRIAELLELVTEGNVKNSYRPWYLPAELFIRLDKVESITYIPSNQRRLYYQLKLLSPDELKTFNTIINANAHNLLQPYLEQYKTPQQILILDSLLAYQEYRLAASTAKDIKGRDISKDQILRARLNLPPQTRPSVDIKELPSPSAGSPPMTFGINIANSTLKEHPFLTLNWSPFKQETVGLNSLEGDELILFNLNLGLLEEEHTVFIDQFDLIRILKLNTLPVSIADEGQWSWELNAGINRMDRNNKNFYDGVGAFGLGRATKLNDNLTPYVMIDLAGHTLAPYARLRPHLGFKIDYAHAHALIYGGAETNNYTGGLRNIWGGKIQYQLNKNTAIHLDINNEKATTSTLGLRWYW